MDWVFQANPTLYSVIDALEKRPYDGHWAMNQYRSLVAPEDRVFFWHSGSEAAVVAVGRVTSLVYELRESQFGRYAVDVEYDFRVVPSLSRAEIRANPALENARVFQGAQGTNVKLSAEEAIALDRLEKQVETQVHVSEAIQNAREENRRLLLRHIATMDPFEFEWLVAAVLVKSGLIDVEVTKRSGDRGIDVKATIIAGGFAPMRVFVQAKRSPNVGRPAVQKLRGCCPSGYAAMLVASGEFSEEATEDARDPKMTNLVTLINGRQLADLMLDFEVGVEQQKVAVHSVKLDSLTKENLRAIVQIADEDVQFEK